ncbi:hypothetical protein, partial [Bifidobacterium scardovii]|uniref:hypothetical protein n=1 Tax=Bifidobacterium scardovii TaxID=158787 RepID=UPI00137686F3
TLEFSNHHHVQQAANQEKEARRAERQQMDNLHEHTHPRKPGMTKTRQITATTAFHRRVENLQNYALHHHNTPESTQTNGD